MTFQDLTVTDADFEGKNIQSIAADTVIGKAEELKKLFDAPAQEVLKEKFNALLAYLQQTGAGGEIGTPEISEGSGRTVAAQLAYLLEEMQNISAGSIADGAITDGKLSDADGQIKQAVAWLKAYLYDFALNTAPHNAVVRVNATYTDDMATNALTYTAPEQGALHYRNEDETLRFGTLPVECGGTYNKDLASAADGGIIVKRTSNAGSPYLGYTTMIPIENGGTGAVSASAARSKLGAAAEGHTHENESVSMSFNTTNFKNGAVTVRYNPVTKTCFARIYCATNKALTAGEVYTVGTIASRKPENIHALAHAGAKDAAVTIDASGKIELRPRESIAAGYDNYITGFWYD